MPSFYDLSEGDFRGNCPVGATPPEGQRYTEDDPTHGMNNPRFVDGIWVAGEPVPEAEPSPDWEGLVAEVMSNPEFKAAWIAAAAIDPTIAWSLPTAFGMVGQGHPGNFINLFNAICALAQVTLEQRAIWADIGAMFNAPTEFLDIVRGTNGE